jgi:hypothetical protein
MLLISFVSIYFCYPALLFERLQRYEFYLITMVCNNFLYILNFVDLLYFNKVAF